MKSGTIAWRGIVIGAAAMASTGVLQAAQLVKVADYNSGVGSGTEILSVQQKNALVAVNISSIGAVDILNISDPSAPTQVLRINLGLAAGEMSTSVAFHPVDPVILVTIITADPMAAGRVDIRNSVDGSLIKTLPVGVAPDSVILSENGKIAVVANEGEQFVFDAATKEFNSAPGSVSVIDLTQGEAQATVRQIALPDATGVPGFVTAADARMIERAVDVNGNGVIDAAVDFNGDSDMSDKGVVVGHIKGQPVLGNEADGETFLIPIVDSSPLYLEPEYSAVSNSGHYAYVTLQENNGMAVVDAFSGQFLKYFGVGKTTHLADRTEDGNIAFTEELVALREPDGVALDPTGRFLITGDEGDTDPKASKTKAGFATGGGRTVTVYEARTGTVLGDTGNQIDEKAAAANTYPDGRSDSKGSEPENLTTFMHKGVPYAAVGLERADAVALVSLKNPVQPTVESVTAIAPGSTTLGTQSPEGVGHFNIGQKTFVLTANESSGLVSVFQLVGD